MLHKNITHLELVILIVHVLIQHQQDLYHSTKFVHIKFDSIMSADFICSLYSNLVENELMGSYQLEFSFCEQLPHEVGGINSILSNSTWNSNGQNNNMQDICKNRLYIAQKEEQMLVI